MKKIIDGKMYNTETATKVADYGEDYASDINCWSEILYIKKTGEWFLYGEGGPNSPYSERCGNNRWCGSSTIKPYTPEQAKRWLAEYDCVDEYIKYFGEPKE